MPLNHYLNRLNINDPNRIIPKRLPPNGNRSWVVSVQPSVEPITLTELKTFARIDGTAEDNLLTGFIVAIRKATEKYLGRSLMQQMLVVSMDWWPGVVVELPRPPLIDVCEVRTVSEVDIPTIYASTNYYFRTVSEPGQLIIRQGSSFPQNTSRDYGGYEIEFIAGYGSAAADVPEGIKEAIKLWTTALYENRTVSMEKPTPEAVTMLVPYKIMKI